jgi:hypothetical protein
MLTTFLRITLTVSIVFLAISIIVNGVLALLMGSLPNNVQLPVGPGLDFLQILWQANPWETARLVFVDGPLVVIEQRQQETGLQVWGIFHYTGTVLVYLMISVFTAVHRGDLVNGSKKQRALFAAGLITVLIGVTYLRHAACCSSEPGWVLETWLLAKVYTPNAGAADWMLIYARIQPWLPLMQTGVLMSGVLMLYRWRLGFSASA